MRSFWDGEFLRSGFQEMRSLWDEEFRRLPWSEPRCLLWCCFYWAINMCSSCLQLLTHLCARHHAEASHTRLQLHLALSRWRWGACSSSNSKKKMFSLTLPWVVLFSDSGLYQSPGSLRTRRRTCAIPRKALFCSSISLINSGNWASQLGNLSTIAHSAPTTTGITIILTFYSFSSSIFNDWHLSIFSSFLSSMFSSFGRFALYPTS